METTVEKLEMMFSKSEADLEYIEKRLKLNFTNNAAESDGSSEENPAVMLENLRSIKAKHAELCCQVKEIAAAQKESMDSIRQNMSSIVDVLQNCQNGSDAKIDLMTKLQPECAEFLGHAISQDSSQSASEISSQEQRSDGEGVSAAAFEAVPVGTRGNVQLSDLNVFYQQLRQHTSKSSKPLAQATMKQLKMNVSNNKLKVLQHLNVIQMDGKGHVTWTEQ